MIQRCEKKYLIDRAKYMKLKTLLTVSKDLSDHFKIDEYTISNVYYDTDDYDLIGKSIEKPPYKEKLRLRSYGDPNVTYAEIKKKYDGTVYKRREMLPLSKDSVFSKELDHLLKRYDVKPKIFIAYDRTVFETEGLRITFDDHIRYREDLFDFHNGTWGNNILPPGKSIMEIKVSTSIPLWLCRFLSENQIYPAPFSKYGECYKQKMQGAHGGAKSA